MSIDIEMLSADNFGLDSLDGFIRHQRIEKVWKRTESGLQLESQPFTEDWDQQKCREIAARMLSGLRRGYYGVGAFDCGRLVGWAFYNSALVGKNNNYAVLEMFHVSEPYRGNGIGRRLFDASLPLVRSRCAERIFISAHPSEESQAVYRALGCVPAAEFFAEAAADEPFDIQLEYILR